MFLTYQTRPIHHHHESWRSLAFWFPGHFSNFRGRSLETDPFWGEEARRQGPQVHPKAAFPPQLLQLSCSFTVTPLGRVTEAPPRCPHACVSRPLSSSFWTFILHPTLPAALWVPGDEHEQDLGSQVTLSVKGSKVFIPGPCGYPFMDAHFPSVSPVHGMCWPGQMTVK